MWVGAMEGVEMKPRLVKKVLQLSEVLQCLVKVVPLQGGLDEHHHRTAGELDPRCFHFRDKRIHFLEVARGKVHAKNIS